MIAIRNFKEMAELHQAGQVPFRIVQEITAVLLGLTGYKGDIPEAVAITQMNVDWLLALEEDIKFERYLGGNAFMCETEADLSELVGMDCDFSKVHGRWPNCMEAILPLDEARYLANANGSADYALLFAATNNAGGPSWFIPRHLWQAAQIAKQIEAHQQFWSVPA